MLTAGYNLGIFYKEDIILYSRSKFDLMTTYKNIILHGLYIANPFLPNLWGYMYGFSYWLIYELIWQISLCQTLWGFVHRFNNKLEIKSEVQYTIKAKSLEVAFLTIILICDVFYMLLLKHIYWERACVWEHYEMYKMSEKYEEIWDRWKITESVQFSQ